MHLIVDLKQIRNIRWKIPESPEEYKFVQNILYFWESLTDFLGKPE
jgi:hypothetical protein